MDCKAKGIGEDLELGTKPIVILEDVAMPMCCLYASSCLGKAWHVEVVDEAEFQCRYARAVDCKAEGIGGSICKGLAQLRT